MGRPKKIKTDLVEQIETVSKEKPKKKRSLDI